MGLLDGFRRPKGERTEVQGALGYFNLGHWWLANFTVEERRYIEEKYQPLGGRGPGARPLTQGSIGAMTQSAAALLTGVSTWFMRPGERHLAIRVLAKAEDLAEAAIDRHFAYSQMIEAYYAERESQPGALDAAIAACERQIAIAPEAWAAFVSEADERGRRLSAAHGKPEASPFVAPSHRGFQQLAIIREKQGDFAEALRLCREASDQGWRDGKGDWSNRMSRLERRLSKAG